MKYFLAVLLGLVLSLHGFSQGPVNPDSDPIESTHPCEKTEWGMAIGNRSTLCNGLRILVFGSAGASKGYITNGIELNVLNDANAEGKINGINLGLFYFDEEKVNGWAFSHISFGLSKLNGLAFSGISMNIDKQNGIGLSGLLQQSEAINGISLAGIDITSRNLNGVALSGLVCLTDSTMNGIEIAAAFARAETVNGLIVGIVTKTSKTKGLQIGLINRAHTMHGFQIGLINNIQQNPRWCRTLPFINFRFAMDTSEKLIDKH
ncbi:MAG: hypothetical protein WAQ28_14630 [Bacteroidia bacterium]|jgi:hypothetical protein